MIYLTQLIYVREGREADFQQFEEIILPRFQPEYSGELVLRLGQTGLPKSLAPAIAI